MTKCPACLVPFEGTGLRDLAGHLLHEEHGSDPAHVRWLNQNVGRARMDRDALEGRLAPIFDLEGGSLSEWILARFVAKFYGGSPHPFILAMQPPSRPVLLGYVLEHRHFLRQWVRSCAYVMARSDEDDVIRYELDNLDSEFGGLGRPERSHYELLIAMGQSLGLDRSAVLASPPLATTQGCLDAWQKMASEGPWLEALAAMHSLELIAHRDLVKRGATLHYFDPSILHGDGVTEATKAFLREGYEADVGHSEAALALVDRYADSPEAVQGVQAACLRSFDLFDDYLLARLERASEFEG